MKGITTTLHKNKNKNKNENMKQLLKRQQQTSQQTPQTTTERGQQGATTIRTTRIKFLEILKTKKLTNQNRLFFFKMATDFFRSAP